MRETWTERLGVALVGVVLVPVIAGAVMFRLLVAVFKE